MTGAMLGVNDNSFVFWSDKGEERAIGQYNVRTTPEDKVREEKAF